MRGASAAGCRRPRSTASWSGSSRWCATRRPVEVPQLPRSELRRLRWVELAYEAEVEYAEVSPDGLLRQPRYAGLREREG